MTLLPGPGTRARSRSIVLGLTALLLTASLAGCIGDESQEDDDDGLPDEALRLFIASLGDASTAEAALADASVELSDGSSTSLTVLDKTLDLAELSENGQAILAGFTTEASGDVTATSVSFSSFEIDGTDVAQGGITVPLNYTATGTTEVTLTLNLEQSAEEDAPVFENLVVEDDGTRVASITRAELGSTPRQEIEPLPMPSIVVRPGTNETNDTAPSFHINDPVSFEVTFDEEDVPLREVFWAFGDGTTSSGRQVDHTYRKAGFFLVGAIAEGEQGQQARTNTTVDIYWTTEGEGNINLGTGGRDTVEGRDAKNHTLEIMSNFTSIKVRVEDSPSGGACDGTLGTNECAPSNVHIELFNPDGKKLAENTGENDTKWLNLTGLMQSGEWTLKVKGDSGAAFGYTFSAEVHHLGLCADAGGPPTVTECPGEPTQENAGE